MRILLEGTCGANYYMIGKEISMTPSAIRTFMNRKGSSEPTRDAIAVFIWKKLNAHLLLCDEDKQ